MAFSRSCDCSAAAAAAAFLRSCVLHASARLLFFGGGPCCFTLCNFAKAVSSSSFLFAHLPPQPSSTQDTGKTTYTRGECTAIRFAIHLPAAAFHCTRTGSRELCVLPFKHVQHGEGLPALGVRVYVLLRRARDAVACEAVPRLRDCVGAVPQQVQLAPEVVALDPPCLEPLPRQCRPLCPAIPGEGDDAVQVFPDLQRGISECFRNVFPKCVLQVLRSTCVFQSACSKVHVQCSCATRFLALRGTHAKEPWRPRQCRREVGTRPRGRRPTRQELSCTP